MLALQHAAVVELLTVILMKHLHTIIPALCLALVACTDTPEPATRRLVVEGRFDSDGYPDVIVTLSLPADGSESELAEALMRWATVTVTDDDTGREVILTGAPSRGHFPPYHYYTFDMRGEPGHTYTMRARYRDMLARATATMPAPTHIDSVRPRPVDSNPRLRSVEVYFTAPDDCPAYYHVSTRLVGQDRRPLPATLGVIEAVEPRRPMCITAMRAKTSTDTVDFTPYFPVGSIVDVRLERVSPEVYEFWRMFSNTALFGASELFNSSFSLPSNISGGYGIWSVAGTSAATVEL